MIGNPDGQHWPISSVIHLSFSLRFTSCIVMNLRGRRQLESRWRRESEVIIGTTAVQPGSSQIEWRLWPRLRDGLRRQGSERSRPLKLSERFGAVPRVIAMIVVIAFCRLVM
jgi:hypothetical protein